MFSNRLPLNTGESLRPLYPMPMTLLLITMQSSLDKFPVHILSSVFPYCGSSLKQCSLLSMITTFMLLSQTPLGQVENKSSLLLLQIGSS